MRHQWLKVNSLLCLCLSASIFTASTRALGDPTQASSVRDGVSEQASTPHRMLWPIKQWRSDFRRAHVNADTASLKRLVDDSPEFAKVWFYGDVFTLATPLVPAAQKAKVGATLHVIAQRLAERGDHEPRLLLEREGSEAFNTLSSEVTALQDRLHNYAPQLELLEQRLSLCFEQLPKAHLSVPTFYGLLDRALRHRGDERSLQDPIGEAAYLNAALPLAECALVFQQDSGLWSALIAYHEGQLPKRLESSLLNQEAAKLWGALARRALAEAQEEAQGLIDLLKNKASAGARLVIASVLLVQADLAAQRGEAQEAVRLVESVERAFLDRDQAALSLQLSLIKARALTQGAQWLELATLLNELVKTPARFEESAYAQQTLIKSTEALIKAVEEERAAARPREALPLIEPTLNALNLLTDGRYLSEVIPQAAREQRVASWRLTRASFYALTASIYEDLGDLERAQAQLNAARTSHPNPREARPLLLSWELDHARLAVDEGEAKVALAKTLPLLENLYLERRPHLLAITALIQGRAYHQLGQESAAFTFANYGLKVLTHIKDKTLLKETIPLHASLHATAARALAGLGHLNEAAARLKRSLAFEERVEERTSYVWLLAQLGRHDEAMRALEAFSSSPLQAQVIRGCLQAERGAYQEAIEALQATYALSAPERSLKLMGRACLIYAHLADGRPQTRELSYLRARMGDDLKSSPDPRLTWRLKALEALSEARSGRQAQSFDALRSAWEGWRVLRGERLTHGWRLEAQTFALPRTPAQALTITHALQGPMRRPQEAELHLKATWWLGQMNSPLPQTRLLLNEALLRSSREDLNAEGERVALMSALSDRLSDQHKAEELEGLMKEALKLNQTPHPTEARLFPQPPELPQFGKEVMSLYFFELGGRVYRATQQGTALTDLASLGSSRQLIAQIKAWSAALSQRPTPWPASARRDPHGVLWKQGYRLARALLPRELLKSEGRPQQLNLWLCHTLSAHLEQTGALEALPLSLPRGRATGEAPEYLAVKVPTFFMADPSHAPIAELAQGKEITRRARCTREASCGAQWAPLSVDPERVLTTDVLTSEALFEGQGLLLWGDQDLTVIEGLFADLAQLPGGDHSAAQLFYFERLGLNMKDLRSLSAHLMSQGLKAVAWPRWAVQGTPSLAHDVIKAIQQGVTPSAALHLTRLKRATRTVNLEQGGEALAHPYFWASEVILFRPDTLRGLSAHLKEASSKLIPINTKPTPAEPTPEPKAPVFEAEPTPAEPAPALAEPVPEPKAPVFEAEPTPAPVEPAPAPVEPAPVEPAPVEPAPVEPAPVEPAPVEPAPVEPAPIEPAPVEPAPVEPAPVEPAPVEPAPVEPATEETDKEETDKEETEALLIAPPPSPKAPLFDDDEEEALSDDVFNDEDEDEFEE